MELVGYCLIEGDTSSAVIFSLLNLDCPLKAREHHINKIPTIATSIFAILFGTGLRYPTYKYYVGYTLSVCYGYVVHFNILIPYQSCSLMI
jgi:hypothetical protein